MFAHRSLRADDAYGYWRNGDQEKEAVFNLSFRQNPFQGGFAIFCGLTHLIDFLLNFRFEDNDIAYLASLSGADGEPLFDEDFLGYLRSLQLTLDIDSMLEGSVVFAHEPLLRVRGPIIQCQLLETILLNIVNFQTLIATKAARMRLAAGETSILEFGMRRAQGADGALGGQLGCLCRRHRCHFQCIGRANIRHSRCRHSCS